MGTEDLGPPGIQLIKKNSDLFINEQLRDCLLYTSPSPRDRQKIRMPSSA